MDREDENFLEKSDWSTYNDERGIESCSYCGEELENLNIVYYQFDKDNYDKFKIVAVNPKPHEPIVIEEGCVKRMELVCDECLILELGYAGHQ